MKGISQLIVAILLVGVAIATGSTLSFMVSGLMEVYMPRQISVSRIGEVEAEVVLEPGATDYTLLVNTKLVNLGSTPFILSGIPGIQAYTVVLVKGTTGKGVILECPIQGNVMIMPGEIESIKAMCSLEPALLNELYGVENPPSYLVEGSVRYLYIKIEIEENGNGEGGNGGDDGGDGGSSYPPGMCIPAPVGGQKCQYYIV